MTVNAKTAWNAARVIEALKEKYALPAFAFLPNVGDSTGWSKSRTADALAMGCWPSRGLYLYGFEVKASRSDWKRELDNPAKAEAICRYCDFWYVACGARGIVQEGELPPTWGLLEPKGDKLIVTKEAPQLEPRPISRPFLAAVLRRAAECRGGREVIEAAESKARAEGFQDGRESQTASNAHELTRLREDLANYERRLKSFEEASGIRIDRWTDGRKLGEAVRMLTSGGPERLKRGIDTAESAAKDVLRLVEIYRNALNTVDEAGSGPIADKVGAIFDARPVGGGLSDGQ
jgi:hypothetical protein